MWLLFTLISTLMWAFVNVLDSLIVRNYEKNPFVLMWCQSFFSLLVLAVLPLWIDLSFSSWVPFLMLFGVAAFLGDLWFFKILRHIDVSVTNAAWAIHSLLASVAGFLIFQESWTLLQTGGAMMILAGILLLSFLHHSEGIGRTLGFLVSLAFLYLPYYIMKKAAIDANVGIANVFFWMLLGRELLAFSVPWFVPSVRRSAVKVLRSGWSFSLFNGVVILCFLLGELFGAYAYETGTISLVSIVSDIQPFIVMGLAWLFVRLLPARAPRELLTMQAVRVKLISFSIVFGGLALLAFG